MLYLVGYNTHTSQPFLAPNENWFVLMSAALIDDIAGLVLAAIISYVLSAGSNSIKLEAIVRPTFVSIAFAIGTSFLAWASHGVVNKIKFIGRRILHSGSMQLFMIAPALSGFVTGAQYAGTSQLCGAYLAGVLFTYAFDIPSFCPQTDLELDEPHNPEIQPSDESTINPSPLHTSKSAFNRYYANSAYHLCAHIFCINWLGIAHSFSWICKYLKGSGVERFSVFVTHGHCKAFRALDDHLARRELFVSECPATEDATTVNSSRGEPSEQ